MPQHSQTAFLGQLFLCSLALWPGAGWGQVPARREPWTTSRITGSPDPPRPYVTERVFPSLTFDQPVELVAIPGTSRLAVLEVGGKIFSFENSPDARQLDREHVADIALCHPSFFRLYGLAFHPKFAENRYCYVSYVLKDRLPDGSRVSRFKMTDSDPPRLDLASEQIVLTWLGGGHNGAHLQFGPDGCLFISTGDGGDSFPPDGRNTGQNLTDLEACILRIDVDRAAAGQQYRIPADNPFAGRPGTRGEIWAYGLRNPWKMCFDPDDGSLWIGDVGWEMWEMIYRVERGGNYGWSIVEASQPVHEERERGPTPILPPTVAHSHVEARSITGGYFVYGPRRPELRGKYVYGDYVTGKIWGLKHDGGRITWREELVDTPLQIVSFGLDHAGELLIVDYPSGTLHRLAANPTRGANAAFPQKLSESGLFADTPRHVPAQGVVPYKVAAQPWADGTTAERFIALPGRSRLGVFTKTDTQIGFIAGDWQFPQDGVLAKTVSIEFEPGRPESRRRLETQVLHYVGDAWRAYNFIWNDEQTDAVLAPDEPSNSSFPVAGETFVWTHASRAQCLICHTSRAGSIHGFRPEQLGQQVADFERQGLLAQAAPSNVRHWPDPHDASQPLEDRARSYLHVNCGQCHRRGGGGSSFFDVQFHLPPAKTSLIGTRPTQGTFGIAGAEIVAPGDPYRSVLLYRMSKLGHGRMPQFGSQVVDPRGTLLIHDWIASLPRPVDLPPVPADEQQSLERLIAGADVALDRLLATPSGGLVLLRAIDDGRLKGEVLRLAIDRGAAHADPAVRDLFQRFLPEEQRVKRLGSVVKPETILALIGEAQRGRSLFFEAAGVQCRNCHRVGEQGHTLGPDLTEIGKKYDKAKLLESILDPSKEIGDKYVSYLVETGGQVLAGLIVQRTDAEVVLQQADRKEVRIPTSEIDRLASQRKSLMPDLLVQEMTAEQVADLLAFLAELK
jgi:putative heme-binding domain-containing protein